MDNQQYFSRREREEIEKATEDLDAFVANFMASDKDVQTVTWADIELKHELPVTVVQGMPFKTVCDVLEEYANRTSIKQSVIEAQKLEAQATDINCFDLKPKFSNPELNQYFCIEKPRITAVIDWLRLKIVVSEQYVFKRPTQPYKDVKDFLKVNGINDKPYVKQISSRTFEIDLHDVASGKAYTDILHKLRAEYDPSSMKIITLEVSLDFWNMSASPFLLALSKSLRVGKDFENTDLRIYNDECGKSMPKMSLTAMTHVYDKWTIGIGHRDKGDLYVRTYYKVKDREQPLSEDQHRTRIEVNLRGTTLESMGNDADNLKHLTNESFKLLKFTHLTVDATAKQKNEYRKCLGLFGKEVSVISKNRNTRLHPDHIESYAELNRVVSKAVSNFIRKF